MWVSVQSKQGVNPVYMGGHITKGVFTLCSWLSETSQLSNLTRQRCCKCLRMDYIHVCIAIIVLHWSAIVLYTKIYIYWRGLLTVTFLSDKVLRRPQKAGRVTRLPAFFVLISYAEILGVRVRTKLAYINSRSSFFIH